MIDIPFQILNVSKWQAFRALLPNGSTLEHRIIIITNVPTIQYFYITSQVDKAKLRASKDISSLVELSPQDWKECLSKDCCIQCSRANMKSINVDDLMALHKKHPIRPLGEVPDNIKTKIKAAICQSKTYSSTEKKFYTL